MANSNDLLVPEKVVKEGVKRERVREKVRERVRERLRERERVGERVGGRVEKEGGKNFEWKIHQWDLALVQNLIYLIDYKIWI